MKYIELTRGKVAIVDDKNYEYLNQFKWRASVKVNGATKNLGNYDDIEEAARARDEAAKIYYGEFARLNFTELEDIEVK